MTLIARSTYEYGRRSLFHAHENAHAHARVHVCGHLP
jgi:hypothetical protein